MSVCLTKTEIIAGSVDGTVRTFDIRMGRYVSFKMVYMLFFSTPQELTLLIHRSNYNSLFTQTLSCDFFMIVTREISDDLGQPVNCISLSNDGNCVLAGCLDSTLRLLDRYLFFPRSYSCKFLSPKC